MSAPAPDRKTLTIKMRGPHGCAKTEMLLALARFARRFGMAPALTLDGHNMVVTSTKAQRIGLYESNHRADPNRERRELLP